MDQHHPVFMPPDITVHSGDHLNKHLEKLLGKSVPRSDSGTAPKGEVPQQAAADGYGSGTGPIFSDLIASGAIVDGGAATPGVAERFTENLATMIGASTGTKNFYGKRAKSGSEDAEHVKSKSPSRSATASQEDDEEVLERFAAGVDRELRKRKVEFGRGPFKVGARAVHRDGIAGTIVKATREGLVDLKTANGELRALAEDVMLL